MSPALAGGFLTTLPPGKPTPGFSDSIAFTLSKPYLFLRETNDSFKITFQKMHMLVCSMEIKLAKTGVVKLVSIKAEQKPP